MSLIRHPIPQRLRTVMLLVVLCLLPGTVLYAWQFGVVVWLQVFWCVLFALGFEAALLRLRGHDVRKGLSDLSWLVLGLILARALPLMVPLWMIALAGGPGTQQRVPDMAFGKEPGPCSGPAQCPADAGPALAVKGGLANHTSRINPANTQVIRVK